MKKLILAAIALMPFATASAANLTTSLIILAATDGYAPPISAPDDSRSGSYVGGNIVQPVPPAPLTIDTLMTGADIDPMQAAKVVGKFENATVSETAVMNYPGWSIDEIFISVTVEGSDGSKTTSSTTLFNQTMDKDGNYCIPKFAIKFPEGIDKSKSKIAVTWTAKLNKVGVKVFVQGFDRDPLDAVLEKGQSTIVK